MDKFAKKLWENDFGNSKVGYDFYGLEVRKGSYAQTGSQYGWNIDHIYPESMGGSDDFSNLQITHIYTNSERGNKNTFWVDGTKYQVKRITRVSDDEVADYPYDGKDYCIVILGHSPEYYEEEEERRRQWHYDIGDEDYPGSYPF